MSQWPAASAVWWMLPVLALCFGLLALGPLGQHVLARGVVFMDLAVAQSAAAAALALGVAVDHPPWWAAQTAALGGALAAVAWVAWISKQTEREAYIGLLYVGAASLALMAAQLEPHGKDRLATLLAADVLWASPQQVLALAGLAAAVWAVHGLLARNGWFHIVFAIAVAVCVQVLGLFVVFACLIAPGLWRKRLPAPLAFAICSAAVALAFALSWHLDWPSGVCTACALSLCGLLSCIKPPQR
jgi:zinc/manganese transport system permease protein